MSAQGEPDTAPAPHARDTVASFATSLAVNRSHPDGTVTNDGVQPLTDQLAADSAPVLFTPAQAAGLLQVPESWLRRRAAQRQVPCTFLGKHLRFSRANLDQIVADAAVPPSRAGSPSASSATRRRSHPRGRRA